MRRERFVLVLIGVSVCVGLVLMMAPSPVAMSANRQSTIVFDTAGGYRVSVPVGEVYRQDNWKTAVHLKDCGIPTVTYPAEWGRVLSIRSYLTEEDRRVYTVSFRTTNGDYLYVEFALDLFERNGKTFSVFYRRDLPAIRMHAGDE